MLKKQKIFSFIFILAIILPLLMVVKPIIEGSIPFWYDAARDLLLAWDNLRKPTLIGPTTGISGVFYGPYWVWLLSIGLFISKDPRVVAFVAVTIPYFILLPYILWKFSKSIFDKTIVISLWLFFVLSHSDYINQIWSPNLAPLLFLIICYLVVVTDLGASKIKYVNLLILGFSVSLLLSFLFSLAMVVPVSMGIYFLFFFILDLFHKRAKFWFLIKKWISIGIVFSMGIFFGLLPTLLFEFKHGFNQFKALQNNLTQGYINNTAAVTGGLNQQEIVTHFFKYLASAVHLPPLIYTIVIGIVLVYLATEFARRKLTLKNEEWRIILFLFTTVVSLFLIFFTSKNPVFDYRFYGMEIVSLILIGFFAKKINFFKKIVIVWALIFLAMNFYSFINSFHQKKISIGLAAREDVVHTIYKDAGSEKFVYLAKNPAIYTFEYDYLFKWMGKSYGYQPSNFIANENLVYLIIPDDMKGDREGFTQNRTPKKLYKTIKEWETADRTLVIKRRRNK